MLKHIHTNAHSHEHTNICVLSHRHITHSHPSGYLDVCIESGEGNGNPLHRSCLENPRDGGAWWAVVYRIAQSRTRLKQLSSSSIESYIGTHTHTHKYACSRVNTHKLIPSHVWPFKVSTAVFTGSGHGGQEPPAPRPQLGNGPSSLSPTTAFPMIPSLLQWLLVWVPLCYPLISAPSHLHQAVPLAWKPSPWSPT